MPSTQPSVSLLKPCVMIVTPAPRLPEGEATSPNRTIKTSRLQAWGRRTVRARFRDCSEETPNIAKVLCGFDSEDRRQRWQAEAAMKGRRNALSFVRYRDQTRPAGSGCIATTQLSNVLGLGLDSGT